MAELSVRWVLRGDDRAVCVLGGGRPGGLQLPVSRVTTAPEDLLSALTALLTGEGTASVRWRSESFLHHWHFTCADSRLHVSVRRQPDHLEAPADSEAQAEGADAPADGAEIWSAHQPVRAFARALIKAFDHVLRVYGRIGYRQQWGAPFPRNELEALRTICRAASPS